MPFCKKCGRGVDQDSRVCTYCGASQVPPRPLIDLNLLVIVLFEIVFFAVMGLWSGSWMIRIISIAGILYNVGILGIDSFLAIYRDGKQRP